MHRSALFPLVCSLAVSAMAQERELAFKLHGTTTDHDTGRPIAQVWVAATDTLDPTYVVNAQADRKGKYEMELPYERTYRVVFSKEGHVPKQVLMDLHGAGEKERTAGFTMDLEMVLFLRSDQVDYTDGEPPVAICRYDPRKTAFTWDAAYSKAVKARLADLAARHKASLRK